MLVYSSMHAFIWIVALFLIKERRRPQSVGAPRRPQRWLPERINGQFYSVAASIFLALFGYLVGDPPSASRVLFSYIIASLRSTTVRPS